MNKYKKIATAVVSIAMAGTMVCSVGFMAACTPSGGGSSKLEVKTDENGNLTYAANTQINFNVGNKNSNQQGISYTMKDLSGASYMIDGKSYTTDDLKPAWAAMANQLKIKAVDVYQNNSSDDQITKPLTDKNISNFDVITGSLSAINQNTSNFVNLAEWLDYMPNYKAFLDANKVTMYSLTGDTKGGMYAAPYYDGNNDIEYYHTIRKDWVSQLLDATEFDATQFQSFADQAKVKDSYKVGSETKYYDDVVGNKSSIKPYMGTEEKDNYVIETVNPDGGANIFVKLNYKAANEAAKGETPLGNAIKAAANGTAYTGDSGNIVDLQNHAIDKSEGAVTGDKLAKIVQEYIKVAYERADAKDATSWTKMYTTKPSEVFNSASGAWDVDLLAATLRCIVSTKGYLDGVTSEIYGIVSRQATSQRRVMLLTMASELYGVRGLGSRLEYIYIGADGELRDSRQNADSYEVLNRLSAFAKEGILYTGEEGADGFNSYKNDKSKVLGAMSYDFIQTQTKSAITGAAQAVAPTYNYAPIVVPVSRWDTDDDGTHETVMRFTESWRSVKNTGFCIPVASVAGKPDKFSAVLTFIDYLYSSDGQILMTYGGPSTTDSYDEKTLTSSDNGFWYAKPSTLTLDTVVDATKTIPAYGNIPAQYTLKDEYKLKVFVYDGKVYEGIEYGGRVVPQITKANYALFTGKEIKIGANSVQQNKGNLTVNQVGSYTNYARYILGTTLPIGNKNQGFEFQCTAKCGQDGASIVDKAITAGVIKHVVVDTAEAETPWYFISPTAYPLTSQMQTTLKNQTKMNGYFRSNGNAGEGLNVYLEVMFYGFGTKTWFGKDIYILGEAGNGTLLASGEAYVTWLKGEGLTERVNIYKGGWTTLKNTYNIFK